MSVVNVKLNKDKIVHTTIATSQEQVDEAIKVLMSNSTNRKRLIGLDMIPIRVAPESSISTSGKASNAIMSLCYSSQCLIIRLHSLQTVPESLYNFLILPCFTFAGFDIKETKESLKKDYGLVCKNVLEVGPGAWRLLKCFSLELGNVFRSMKIPPTSSISDAWGSNCELNEDEVTHAVSNAYASFRLGYNILPPSI